MSESKTLLEWERKARNAHDTYVIAIPKPLAKKWKIGPGSILTVQLNSDGALEIIVSEEEIAYQKRTEGFQ